MTDTDDLGPIAARTLLASPPFPPSTVGGLTTQQLGHVLRGVELAMRLEQLSDDAIERVLHRMVYGSPLGAVAHDVTPDHVTDLTPTTAELTEVIANALDVYADRNDQARQDDEAMAAAVEAIERTFLLIPRTQPAAGPLDAFDIQERAGVISMWFTPNPHTDEPVLSLEILGGQKRYARVWLRGDVRVGWGWTLGEDAVCLWRDPDSDSPTPTGDTS